MLSVVRIAAVGEASRNLLLERQQGMFVFSLVGPRLFSSRTNLEIALDGLSHVLLA